MHRDNKEKIRKQLLHYLDTGTTDYAESTMRLDPRSYRDPEHLTREHRTVFAGNPAIVAHRDDLPEPGAFVTTQVAGTPMLVVRQDDGSVRAFGNICRHRGAKVECEAQGLRKVFSCPYHRWSYNLNGTIRSIPYDEGFAGLDRAGQALVEYPADEYAGLVWVLGTPGAGLDMAAEVGPEMDRDVQASGVSSAKLYRRHTFELDMNWKVVMDGLTDAYHLKFVHPKTVGPFFHTNVYQVDSFGKNWRMVVARKGIEKFREGAGEIDYSEFAKYAIQNFTFYPGCVVATEPSHFEAWVVRPDPADLRRSFCTLMFLLPELPTTEKAERFFQRNWDLLRTTVEDEDWVVAKTISDALAHGDTPDLVLGRNEKATQLLHGQLAADLSTP